jgi:hypothetical protein
MLFDVGGKLPGWMGGVVRPKTRARARMGRAKDVRGAGGVCAQVSTWDAEIGGLEMTPPSLRLVLSDLGVKTAAAEVATEVEKTLSDATSEIWRIRCQRQRQAEGDGNNKIWRMRCQRQR